MSLHPTDHRARARCVFTPSRVAVDAALAALASGAQALEFNTGNPDLTVPWDNTVRLNLATRAESRDHKIGNSALSDEGTYSFDKGDMVARDLHSVADAQNPPVRTYPVRVHEGRIEVDPAPTA